MGIPFRSSDVYQPHGHRLGPGRPSRLVERRKIQRVTLGKTKEGRSNGFSPIQSWTSMYAYLFGIWDLNSELSWYWALQRSVSGGWTWYICKSCLPLLAAAFTNNSAYRGRMRAGTVFLTLRGLDLVTRHPWAEPHRPGNFTTQMVASLLSVLSFMAELSRIWQQAYTICVLESVNAIDNVRNKSSLPDVFQVLGIWRAPWIPSI